MSLVPAVGEAHIWLAWEILGCDAGNLIKSSAFWLARHGGNSEDPLLS